MSNSTTKKQPASIPRRRWLRFSLRTLLLAMAFTGLLGGVFGEAARRHRAEQEVIAAIDQFRSPEFAVM